MGIKAEYGCSSVAGSCESIVALLGKERVGLIRADIFKIIRNFGIEHFNFHYTGLDGRIRSLKLPFSDMKTAERLLALGERADGSSLFRGLVDASVSDIYIVPRYDSVFLNPFNSKSLDFMCRFVDRDGELSKFTHDGILARTEAQLQNESGCELWAMGELEFYLVYPRPEPYDLYPAQTQDGYHISEPFFKYENVVDEILHIVQQVTGSLKYAHSEVGNIQGLRSQNPVLAGCNAEQYELEFLPRPINEAAEALCLARWLIRAVAARHGLLAVFTPKLDEDAAGSGMHIHMELRRDGVNCMLNPDGSLSREAMKLIGGVVRYAPSISAFGNTQASSFLRLVPNHEAPTKICWSYSNRSSLVRVPLGWTNVGDLGRLVNPQEIMPFENSLTRQTVELRSPDGSANPYLLLAAIATAVKWGVTHDESLEIAERCHVKGNIFADPELASTLDSLPGSCWECAQLLQEKRALYEEDGCFPTFLIDYIIEALKKEDDAELHTYLGSLTGEAKLLATLEVLQRDLHRN